MPIRPSTICPALIFAASRKERVIGRIIILRDSTRTRKGFNQPGPYCGGANPLIGE